MRFGVGVGNIGAFGDPSGPAACIEVAQAAEALGFDSVWVNDHVVIPAAIESRYPYNATGDFPAPPAAPCFEPLTMMSALAAATARVEIGVSVLVVPYRHPAVTAKMLAAADRISEGRIVLGAGVGWMREEFEALGLSDEQFRFRGTLANDYLRAMKEMWTNSGPSSIRARFVRFEQVGAYPKPAREGGIPIVVGGNGANAWRRASRWGDGYHAAFQTPEQLEAEVAGVRAACRRDRRDPDELEISMLHGIRLTDGAWSDADRPLLCGSPDEVASDLLKYGRVGLEHLIATPTAAGGTPMERVMTGMEFMAAELLPAFGGAS